MDDSEARLTGLLQDLGTLHDYLRERGQHTYELAQRFLANARRDASSRAYDERQATMLEYQHSILSDMNTALWWTFPSAPTAKIHLAQAV
ncbi:MAG TPA: hypothetical protein VGP82_06355 [Ktedonobacterales bacterium]|nr:hypothetical protein [Ktedonobacterales bacterium]